MNTRKHFFTIITFLFCASQFFAEPVLRSQLKPSDAPKPSGRPSVALVLAGGGARGFVHIPIIETLEELDIPIDIVIGTSIGSIVGGLYAAGYTPRQMLDLMSNTNWTPLFSDRAFSEYENLLGEHSADANTFTSTLGWDFKPQLGGGISKGQHVYDFFRALTVKHNSDCDFKKLPTPFAAVALDTLNGETYVFKDGDIAESIRCSMSIPGVFSPFKIGEHVFIDGGTTDNLAIDVAKNLGYDIIIAVDISQQIRSDPSMYEGNPTVAVLNSMTIPQRHAIDEWTKYASLIMVPDIGSYGILSFNKAHEIYDAGKDCAKKYRDQLLEIRKRIFPNDYDKNGNRISSQGLCPKKTKYDEIGDPIFYSYELRGQLENDTSYFKNVLNKCVGRPFTGETYQKILDKMYMTGNYKRILCRLVSGPNGNVLDIQFDPEEMRTAKLIVDTMLESSLGSRNMTRFALSPELQFRGVTGPGSVVALRGDFVNVLGGELYYFMPFNPYFYLKADAAYFSDKYPLSVKKDGYSLVKDFKTWDASLTFGARTRHDNLVELGGFFSSVKCSWESLLDDYGFFEMMDGYDADEEVSFSTAGVNAEFLLDTLDSPVFAQRGFYANFYAKAFVQVRPSVPDDLIPATVLSLDLRQAIPFGRHFSVVLDGFAGFDVAERMPENPGTILAEGFTNYDRVYFPQNSTKERFGIHKVALATSLQWKLGDSLTILGGDAFLRLTGAIGNVSSSYKKILTFSNDDTGYYNDDGFILPVSENAMWCASLGAGLRLKKQFTVYVRMGAGSNYKGDTTGFFAMDIGSIRF